MTTDASQAALERYFIEDARLLVIELNNARRISSDGGLFYNIDRKLSIYSDWREKKQDETWNEYRAQAIAFGNVKLHRRDD